MRFLFSFLLLVAITAFAARAENIYEVKNINISLKNSNQPDIRDKAITAAEKKAFTQLQDKLIASGYISAKQQVPQTRIANAVDSIDVQSEKITAQTYRATYNVTFIPDEISQIFTLGYIEPSKDVQKFLVVPILVQNEVVKIWKNDWRKDWTEQKHEAIILPLGDLQDIKNLKEEELTTNNSAGIDRLKRRYGVNNVVLVTGEFLPVQNALKVKLTRIKDQDRIAITYEYPGNENLSQKDLFAAAANDIIYRLENEKLTDESLITSATEAEQPLPPLPKPVPVLAPPPSTLPSPQPKTNFTDDKFDNPDQPLTVLEEVADNETPAEPYEAAADQAKHLDIIVIARDQMAWDRIKDKLIETDGINNLHVKSFTNGHASISLDYAGEVSELMLNLAAQGLDLSGDAKNWIIRENP